MQTEMDDITGADQQNRSGIWPIFYFLNNHELFLSVRWLSVTSCDSCHSVLAVQFYICEFQVSRAHYLNIDGF